MRHRLLFSLGIAAVLLIAGVMGTAAQDSAPIRIIFMHHSTGLGVIEDGGVRQAFVDMGYEFWDHGYNEEGLVNAAGEWLGVNWDMPDDNTDPDGWANIFNQPVTDPPTNTFSHMLQYDVIMFKSCFPSSNITDDDQLETYRRYYLGIRDVMDAHPDKLFIAWTTPPLVPNATTLEEAARANAWAAWLTSDEYLSGHPNVAVFDVRSVWADADGFLRAEYRVDAWDSHPNAAANEAAGAAMVAFVDETIRAFVPGEPPPADAPPAVVTEATEPAPPAAVEAPSVPVGDIIEDFEAGEAHFADSWSMWADSGVANVNFGLDTPGHNSEHAARIAFSTVPDKYVGFGMQFDAQDWSDAAGITFTWRSDKAGVPMLILLGMNDTASRYDETPFGVELLSPGDAWTTASVTWDQLAKPEWFDGGGADAFDPSQAIFVNFDIGQWDQSLEGVIWLDDFQLMR